VGILQERDTSTRIVLSSRCLVGRAPTCDLVLPQRNVSGEHAALEWSGAGWELQDLGSRNGTFLDGKRLEPEARCLIGQDAQVRFGRESPTWTLTDASAPVAMACDLATRAWRYAEGGYLSLPGPDEHECSIYALPDGLWVVERGSDSRPIEDRATLTTADGTLWRVFLPVSLHSTVTEGQPLILACTRLRFRHSLDEEQVEMVGFSGATRLDYSLRAHHYPLLLLARKRLADRRAGLAAADEGWIALDDLLHMLQMSEPHLNTCIHRARVQLSRSGIVDAASLIERRVRLRRVRIGVHDLDIGLLDPEQTSSRAVIDL
jgi:hypothetical protein